MQYGFLMLKRNFCRAPPSVQEIKLQFVLFKWWVGLIPFPQRYSFRVPHLMDDIVPPKEL